MLREQTTGDVRVGEVIEACTRDFVGQCYELYQSPPLGSLVKASCDIGPESAPRDGLHDKYVYGVVYNVMTGGVEPGRRPIARGKDETSEEEVYRSSPQLLKLLKSEFSALVVGYRANDRVFQHLPSRPACIHSFVHQCSPEEVKQFSRSFDFLNILLRARLDIPVEELVGSTLREMSRVYEAGRHTFLVSAGKELAALLSSDYGQLRTILKGLKNDAVQ